MGKYFLETARHAKAQEFLKLKQGVMTVMDYVARFTELMARGRTVSLPPVQGRGREPLVREDLRVTAIRAKDR